MLIPSGLREYAYALFTSWSQNIERVVLVDGIQSRVSVFGKIEVFKAERICPAEIRSFAMMTQYLQHDVARM